MSSEPQPEVSIIMGSKSDWETMRHADEMLSRFGVEHECQILSAHRTPEAAREYVTTAESRGLKVMITGAGGAAHLAGMVAALSGLYFSVSLKGWADDERERMADLLVHRE